MSAIHQALLMIAPSVDNSYFVTTSTGGLPDIKYSSDGATWFASPWSDAAGSRQARQEGKNPGGYVCFCVNPGSGSLGIASSPTGVIWTRATSNTPASWVGLSISATCVPIWNGSLWACGFASSTNLAYIATSPDFVNWTVQLNYTQLPFGVAPSSIVAICWTGAQFVALRGPPDYAQPQTNDILTSPTGVTWSNSTGANPITSSASNVGYGTIFYFNGYYHVAAISGSRTYSRSADLLTWGAGTGLSPISYWVFGAIGTRLVIGSYVSKTMYYSDDIGVSWTAATVPIASPSSSITGLLTKRGVIVAIHGGGQTYTSTDGATWTIAAALTGDFFKGLV